MSATSPAKTGSATSSAAASAIRPTSRTRGPAWRDGRHAVREARGERDRQHALEQRERRERQHRQPVGTDEVEVEVAGAQRLEGAREHEQDRV
jgi:hypothetical protein